MQTLSTLIREATAADAEAIARVNVVGWRSAYRGVIDDAYLDAMSVDGIRDGILRRFAVEPAAAFTRVLVEGEGRVTGFANAGAARGVVPPEGLLGRVGELRMIYLLPGSQGRGQGARLLRSMARGLERRGFDALIVWVLARNLPARGFYERLGGREIGARPCSVGTQRLDEVAYGWDALSDLIG